MGITVRGDWKCSPEWDMGYAAFFRLRSDIAHAISREFGEHYAKMIHLTPFKDTKDYDDRTEELIRKYICNKCNKCNKCKKYCLEFLYSPDTGYRLTPARCKAILGLIKTKKEKNVLYGYQAYPERCMRMTDFKNLLSECCKRKKALIWY